MEAFSRTQWQEGRDSAPSGQGLDRCSSAFGHGSMTFGCGLKGAEMREFYQGEKSLIFLCDKVFIALAVPRRISVHIFFDPNIVTMLSL